MTDNELSTIFSQRTASIIAPAGHGKTEMITELVANSEGKQLLLTHTHAGVDALQKRLKKKGIKQDKYSITTIASFFIKWCAAYPKTAGINTALSPKNGKKYYAQFYDGMKNIALSSWFKKIISATYQGIIVDEYQDCLACQHDVIVAMSEYIPVRILGDPMQGIFDFENIVNWNNIPFPQIEIKTKPWRWLKDGANHKLGEYLMDIRTNLIPILEGKQCNIDLSKYSDCIKIISPNKFNFYSFINEFKDCSSVVYITKWERQQKSFCQRMAKIFQYDEKQECEDLFTYAELFDRDDGYGLVLDIISFMSNCSTAVNSELKTFIDKLKKQNIDFSRVKNHSEFGDLIKNLCTQKNSSTIIAIILWFINHSEFKIYRKETVAEMIRSIDLSRQKEINIYEAATRIRSDVGLQRRYTNFKYLASRTLLSKGLEFDCVIIDNTDKLNAKNFYVALTRAMKKVYIISDSSTFNFDC